MKPWYRQKALYAGLALLITGLGQWVAEGDESAGMRTLLEGVGLIGAVLLMIRQAAKAIKAATGDEPNA